MLEIHEYPDPCLRARANPVTVFDTAVSQLVEDLLETLDEKKGLGLSATQVGAQQQVLVLAPLVAGSIPSVYVNPAILSKSAWGLVEESCLSIPGVTGNVIRATKVRVSAQDRDGQSFEQDLTGMDAVGMQHEIDHLAGKLFIDRLSIFRRFRMRAFLNKEARQNKIAV